jgi:Protein of unknown function (DUF4230)
MKQRLAIIILIVAVIFTIGLFIGVLLPHLPGIGRSHAQGYNTATILQEVQTLSELVTVKYVMEKVVIEDDPPQNTIRRLLPDDTRVILIAHGIVKAGIDLDKIKPEDLRVSGQHVILTLPKPQITDAYLDEKQTKVVEHNTSFLRDFNKDLEQTARLNAIEDIRRAARSGGILKDADDRARAQLNYFFQQLGLEVQFKSP